MHDEPAPTALRTWLSTLPALAVLLLSVAQGTSEIVQARMLATGEAVWPGYAELRYDPAPPTCVADDIGKDPAPAAAGGDDALLDDLFGDGPPPGDDAAPAAEPDGATPDDALLDDLFDDPAPDAAGEGDLLDDLFGDAPSRGPSAEAIAAAKAKCEAEHARYAELQSRITPSLKAYRGLDTVLSAVTQAGRRMTKPGLVLLILICAATATALRGHIALRPVHTRADQRVSEISQLLANGVVALSFVFHHDIVTNAGIEADDPWVPLVWAAGFGLMGLVNLRNLMQPPDGLQPGGPILPALLTVPLYVTMAFLAAGWFFLGENHPSGLAIYVDKLTEHAALYIQVGLYVWAGMLLKRTRLAARSFDVLRPWSMPPELLAVVVVTVSALPTAYSGASGIFVIAAGAIIYEELRKAGARNGLALAATAMSGSLGVVLSPCLLVVIVASLNKQVTTSELFGAGYAVFALTAALFAVFVLGTRRNPLTLAPIAEALPASRRALRPLLPYVALLFGTIAFYGVVLGAWLDEHSAPRILLVVLLLFLFWDAWSDGPGTPDHPPVGAGGRLSAATTETTHHIGALLTLMALSVAFGGIVERSEVMSMVPEQLGSVWVTMALLTTMLVLVGMVMDPYGAVILVSATIAHVAYRNGIDPLHFWMVVLVAFELGYLTPPVALNHLLTRAVVGPDGDEIDVPADAPFWLRHERLLLPVSVMGTALVIVAFGPLLFGVGGA